MNKNKKRVDLVKENIADIAGNCYGWEEVQQDSRNSMISFIKNISGVRCRVNFYCTKKTAVVQSKSIKMAKTWRMKTAEDKEFHLLFENPFKNPLK